MKIREIVGAIEDSNKIIEFLNSDDFVELSKLKLIMSNKKPDDIFCATRLQINLDMDDEKCKSQLVAKALEEEYINEDDIKVVNGEFSRKPSSNVRYLDNLLGNTLAEFVQKNANRLSLMGNMPQKIITGNSPTTPATGIANSFNKGIDFAKYKKILFSLWQNVLEERKLNANSGERVSGERLEIFACFLFSFVAGIKAYRGKSRFGKQTDVLLDSKEDYDHADFVSNNINVQGLVECKNRTNNTGHPELYKLIGQRDFNRYISNINQQPKNISRDIRFICIIAKSFINNLKKEVMEYNNKNDRKIALIDDKLINDFLTSEMTLKVLLNFAIYNSKN